MTRWWFKFLAAERLCEISFAVESAVVFVYVSRTPQKFSGLSSSAVSDVDKRPAFWNSIVHRKPFTVGINWALGAKEMAPYIRELSRIADTFVHCYPNAGLPNPLAETGYDEQPVDTAEALRDLAGPGLLNVCLLSPSDAADASLRCGCWVSADVDDTTT